MALFADCCNHRHRHCGIKFMTHHQSHKVDAVEICGHQAFVYEQERQRNPPRWSRATRCWRKPEVVWIKPPAAEEEFKQATFAMAA